MMSSLSLQSLSLDFTLSLSVVCTSAGTSTQTRVTTRWAIIGGHIDRRK